MTTRNIEENKRFVFRAPNQKPRTYLVSASVSRPHVATKNIQPQAISAREIVSSSSPLLQTHVHADTRRTEVPPARRVVVIRNTKTSPVSEGQINLGDFGQDNSPRIPPAINNGNTLVYFIRRRITSSQPPDANY